MTEGGRLLTSGRRSTTSTTSATSKLERALQDACITSQQHLLAQLADSPRANNAFRGWKYQIWSCVWSIQIHNLQAWHVCIFKRMHLLWKCCRFHFKYTHLQLDFIFLLRKLPPAFHFSVTEITDHFECSGHIWEGWWWVGFFSRYGDTFSPSHSFHISQNKARCPG